MTADAVHIIEHTLSLTAGVMRVELRETGEAVSMSITGVRPRGFEREKVRRFLFGAVLPYQTDRRPLEISGANSNLVGHMCPVGTDGWIAYTSRRHDWGESS